MDEIIREIEVVAQEGEGADKFRALKYLAGAETASVTLPPPLTSGERIERLARLMKPCGRDETRAAMAMAFPRPAGGDGTPAKFEDLSQAERDLVASITSVQDLYRKIPALKRTGRPSRPMHLGAAAVRLWAQEQAIAYFLDMANARALALANDEPIAAPANPGEASATA